MSHQWSDVAHHSQKMAYIWLALMIWGYDALEDEYKEVYAKEEVADVHHRS